MNMLKVLSLGLLAVSVFGCGLNNDEGEQVAVKMVQEFRPSGSAVPINEKLKAEFADDGWSVLKTSDGLYRVIFQGSTSGKTKELVFGVSINKNHVMALNREALAYTNPL